MIPTSILNGLIGLIFFTCGNILATAYILVEIKAVISKRRYDLIPSALFIGILNLLPPFIAYLLAGYPIPNSMGNRFITIFYALIFFCVGIGWTKKFWTSIENLEEQAFGYKSFIPRPFMLSLFTKHQDYGYPITDMNLQNNINTLSKAANINNLEARMIDLDYINAFAQSKLIGNNILYLTPPCIKELSPEQLNAIIGHELMHFKGRDGTFLDHIKRFVGSLCIIVVFVAYVIAVDWIAKMLPTIGLIITILTLPLILVYVVSMLIFLIIDDRRYWYQIKEIKADRLACTIPGVSKDSMVSLLKRLKLESSDFQNLPWYKKMFYRYLMIMEHPCLERRIHLIENYRKWSILDYISHSFAMAKWFFSGKGWIGM